MRKTARLVVGLVVLLGLLLGSIPVSAMDNPDYVSIGDVFVFRDLLEDGDQLYFVRYDVSYNGTPDEEASDTWQVALYDTDGTTLITHRPLNYYQHNIISMYLGSGDALTWEQAYGIKVLGMPSVFGNLTEGLNMKTRTLGGGDYYEGAQLGVTMLAQARILEDDWVNMTLVENDLLNTTGANYFIKAVPNLGSMCPEIFSMTIVYPDVDYIPWSVPYQDTLAGHGGSRLTAAMTSIGSIVGVSGSWMGAWLLAIIYLVFGGIIYASTKNPTLAIIGAFPLIAAGLWLGLGGPSLLTAVILIVFVVAVIFAIYFILGRFA